MRTLSILGSTGSIGTSALRAARRLELDVVSLTANSSVTMLESQAREFHPAVVALGDEVIARDLRTRLADTSVKVLSGEEGIIHAASCDADICLNAIVGVAGLRPTLAAIRSGVKRVALANKETLVCVGSIVLAEAKRYGVELIPVDSEHSAIFQCIQGQDAASISKLILTASGGPFYGRSSSELEKVTVADALKHPNWQMGKKITVDSATMMNKGLEFIEAMHLFGVSPDDIDIIIHRESIIHSMVMFSDGAVIAQLGLPDMSVPIQYALTYPLRKPSGVSSPDFSRLASLSFFTPDTDAFKCLPLAMDAARRGNAACAALNGANEAAVAAFLDGKLSFYLIADAVERASRDVSGDASVEEVFTIDCQARNDVKRFVAAH